jgi:glycosyltransferase involved in cell wall biosynthesis
MALPVSIVINNYNYGRFLGEAIESALAQTHPGVEVVVVDDGSTDDSREIMARYGERIRPVLRENGGQAAALNSGLAASRGEVIFFLDADDLLHPEAVAEVMAHWRPGVVKVQFLLDVIDAEGAPRGSRFPPDQGWPGELRELILALGTYPSTGTTGNAFDRAALERLMPIPEAGWRRQPDSYLILLLPFLGEALWIDKVLGEYRSHGSNQWTMEELSLERLREQIRGEELREEALREWAPEFGIEVPRDWRLRNPNHLQTRLASLRLDAGSHPYSDDGRWALARAGVRASLGAPTFSGRKRLFFACWFVLAAAVPAGIARPLVEVSFLRSKRAGWLQRLVG